MFGLMTGSDLATYYSNNARRKVFYAYPQGTAPLMGLLSMMDEGEKVDKDNMAWYEDRHTFARGTTAIANATGPFTDLTGVNGAVGADLTTGGFSQTVANYIRIKVVDATVFRVRDFIWIKDMPGATSTTVQVRGIVDVVWATAGTIDVRLTTAITNGLNTTAQNGIVVTVAGSASVAGGYSKLGGTTFPVEPGNNMQIFRSVVGPFDANSVKVGLNFDEGGIYWHAAKKAKLRHMEVMEKAALFGYKDSVSVTDSDDGQTKLQKMMGGVLWFLQDWERGTISNSAAVNYRPGGTDLTSTDWAADDAKRIIAPTSHSLTGEQFEGLIERLFFYNGDQSWEKLILCGQGLLSAFNKYARQASIRVVNLNPDEDTYGMSLVQWDTAFGTIYFKTHPLLTNDPNFRYSGFGLDIGSLMFHARDGRDTQLLTDRQANDFDGRKDEWLTEFTLEVDFPERSMFFDTITSITI